MLKTKKENGGSQWESEDVPAGGVIVSTAYNLAETEKTADMYQSGTRVPSQICAMLLLLMLAGCARTPLPKPPPPPPPARIDCHRCHSAWHLDCLTITRRGADPTDTYSGAVWIEAVQR